MSRKAEKAKFRKNVFVIGSLIVVGLCASILFFAESYENKENIITAPLQGDLPETTMNSAGESEQSSKQIDQKSALESNKQIDQKSALESNKQIDQKSALESSKQIDQKSALESNKQIDQKSALESNKQVNEQNAK